jgi:two-component system LytT family response regulator
MNALLVDDESLPRLHLRELLEEQEVTVVGEASGAAAAMEMTEALRPDVVFLDIRMPGLTGLQLASALTLLDEPPLIVFTTGYAEHAVAAFEQAALDYLVKPISAERLMRTVTRVRNELARQSGRERQRDAILEAAEAAARTTAPVRRLPVRSAYAVRLLLLEDVVCVIARERRVFVRTKNGEEHRVYHTLTHLERVLPSDTFCRVHDSYLVRIDAVVELNFLGNHAYELRLSDSTQVPVGRKRYGELRARLGLDPGPEP